MTEYINKLLFLEIFPIRKNNYKEGTQGFYFMKGVETVLENIENFPSVEFVPRKKGRWISHGKDKDVFECSECHEEVWDEATPYCPYYGAEMKGSVKHDE